MSKHPPKIRKLNLKKLMISLVLVAAVVRPVGAEAQDLEQKIKDAVDTFQRHIGKRDREKKLFIVVRSFFDRNSRRPSKRSQKITGAFFNDIRDRNLGKNKVVILYWSGEDPLEIKDAGKADEVYYNLGVWQKNLLEYYQEGFLITGTSGVDSQWLVITAELVDVATGRVLESLKETLPKGPDDQESAAASLPKEPDKSQVEAAKEASIITTGTVDYVGTANVPPLVDGKDKPEESRHEIKDAEYKVIQGSNYKYEGYMKNGKREGQGTLYFQSGDKYVGQWKDDKKDGRGTYYYADGDKYDGEWKDNNMHGHGVYFYKSGNKYVGQWKNDKKQGHGIYYFKNGDKWEGSYLDNRKNGPAVYTWAGGESQKELWKDGNLVK